MGQAYQQRNGWTVIPADAKPPVNVTNEDRSAIEVYEFCRDKPDRYFLYVKHLEGRNAVATTWTGEHLGSATLGPVYRDNFGGKRQSITIRAINGETYHGTYYKSAGDYARVKRAKRG
jgi:hypothetical protein